MKKLILLILGLSLIAASCDIPDAPICLKSHEETYYDSTGTSMWLMTGNVAFVGMNTEKTRTVCDKYANPNPVQK